MDRWTGVLLFMSYRDPNLRETLQVYDYVPAYLKAEMENPASALSLINSAIIGTIGSVDGSAPQPNSVGWLSLIHYLSGSNAAIRQKWREEILATNYEDFLKYAERMGSWEATLSVAGPKTILEKERDLNLTLIDDL
jgi:presequence protease